LNTYKDRLVDGLFDVNKSAFLRLPDGLEAFEQIEAGKLIIYTKNSRTLKPSSQASLACNPH
jgi:hypothetical protein